MGRTPAAAPRSFWLVKSEPDAFSWEEQVAKDVEPWTGVRNALAARHLREMRVGDRAFFYHSNIGKEIVGVVEVVREAYPDPTDETGRWACVDMKAVAPLPKPVTLAAIKAEPKLVELALVRMSRLSVMPVSAEHWAILARMGGMGRGT
jgi:predicted RNA-binding protein with PUA-like domain